MEIELDPVILKTIEEEASRKGLSSVELVRYVLGERFGSYAKTSFPAPILPANDYSLSATVKPLLALMAAQGALKCPECDQKVSLKAFKAQVCEHCGLVLEFY